MTTSKQQLSQSRTINIPQLVWGEVRLMWQFTYYNLSAAVFPGIIFTLVAFAASNRPVIDLPLILLQSTVYFFLYIYVFDTHNQIMGMEEDYLNKPFRPLVTGDVTLRGAWVRFLVGTVLYTLLGWYLGVLIYTIAWQLMAFALNAGASKHWFWKNSLIATGGIAQLGAAWVMVLPMQPDAWAYIILICMPIALIVSLQDLRDVEGDLKVGRRTFPIAFGDRFTRWEIAISQAAFPPLVYLILYVYFGLTLPMLMTLSVSIITSLIIVVRVLCMRNPKADHRTYMYFTYWYCFMLAAGFFLF